MLKIKSMFAVDRMGKDASTIYHLREWILHRLVSNVCILI